MTNLPERPDPRLRPPDPAGTQPKVDEASLVARMRLQLEPAVDSEAEVIEEGAPSDGREEHDLLPEPAGGGGGGVAVAAHAEAPHAPRFQFLLGALIAIGVVAIVAGAALIFRPNSTTGAVANWSPWHPTSSGLSGAQQIGNHIGPEYRLASGQELVQINGGPLQVAGLPITVVLRSDPTSNGNISVINGTGVLYRLCGLGANCAIDQGKPSNQRHLLLQREALELALYSFRYLDGINQVVVFLPPRMGQQPSEALFFRPGDVAPELDRPLFATLTRRVPSVSGITSSPDVSLVQRLTTSTLYSFSLTQGNQDANVFLVLRPPGSPPG